MTDSEQSKTAEWAESNYETNAEPQRNRSDNPTIGSILERRCGRRKLLRGSLNLAVGAAFSGLGLSACSRSGSSGPSGDVGLGFDSIPVSREDAIQLPPGYSAQVFVPWGTPIHDSAPAFSSDASHSAADQAQQVGMHHDGMHFFPLEGRSDEGLLVVNHEYLDAQLLHPQGPTSGQVRPSSEVHKELAAVGVSVLHVAQDNNGEWQQVPSSRFNRRITGMTPMAISGPAAGSEKLITRYSPEGDRTRGTLSNCSMGVTPWNTYLAAEENWSGCFVNRGDQPREHERYGVRRDASYYQWHTADSDNDLYRRFDAAASGTDASNDFRNEPNHFGWMTEIDPFDPTATPKKRTALGRFAHEGVIFAPADEGKPLVCYSGDDATYEYLYKFVSTEPYHAETAGGHLLDKGRLYAARFNEDCSGEWLPLDVDDPDFAARAQAAGVHFADQADLLINTRLAADLMGATKMDRPEWGAVHPATREVYFTLTNNTQRTEEQVDAANPRPNNQFGHIIRWREAEGDFSATRFSWDIFLLGGDVGTHTAGENPVTLSEENHFANPDGLWIDKRGLLWIQTDASQSKRGTFGNNQMLVADPETRTLRRFLVGPVGCEITGITATPDMTSLFINVQHPGEGSTPDHFTSHWPDGGQSRPRSATVVIRKTDGGVVGT